MKILVDIDGVTALGMESLCRWAHEHFGVRFVPDDIHEHEQRFDMPLDFLVPWPNPTKYSRIIQCEPIPGDEDHVRRFVTLTPMFDLSYHDDAFVESIRPVAGAVEGIRSFIDNGHSVVFATSRPTFSQAATRRWLDALGFADVPVVHVNKGQSANDTGVKANLNGDVLIDDNVGQIEHFASRCGYGILFSVSWNATKTPAVKNRATFVRATDWKHVVDVVNAIENLRVVSVFPDPRDRLPVTVDAPEDIEKNREDATLPSGIEECPYCGGRSCRWPSTSRCARNIGRTP